jgi:ABC-2 type transport system ATP-binding protein
VQGGSVMALLGPNGAGKTTAVRVLSTLLKPDRGQVRIGGYDGLRQPREVQALIGLTGQSASIDTKLSGADNLAMFGRLHHLPWLTIRERSRGLLEQFDLTDAAKKPVRSYSGGMRRKPDLAVSLIGEPSILFLDEPTTGLDPASREALWDIVRSLVAQDTTVLLTTQYLDEADALADQVTFIDAGRVIATGTPAELKARVGQTQLRVTLSSAVDAAKLATSLGSFAPTADGPVVQIPLTSGNNDGLGALAKAIDAIDRAGVSIVGYEVHEPSLDDVYFQLTGHRKAGESREEATPGDQASKEKKGKKEKTR